MTDTLARLRLSPILGKIFHTLDYCLQRELADCQTVLDIGCGPASPLRHCTNISRSVGVEAFKPYLERSRRLGIHSDYVESDIRDLDFPEKSFDAVIMMEVLEHLPEMTARMVLDKADLWARRKVVVSTPNGYFPMAAVDGNNFQRHLSGWDLRQLSRMGFEVRGVSGADFFYLNHNAVHSLTQADGAYSNIRFRPRKLFYSLNALAQIFTYYAPGLAFGLFAVKRQARAI